MADQGTGEQFPHLNLIYRDQKPARYQSSRFDTTRVDENKANRTGHAEHLRGQFRGLRETTRTARRERENAGLPPIRSGVPFSVEVSDTIDLDALSKVLKFEVVLENIVEGDDRPHRYVLVALEDIESPDLLGLLDGFTNQARGSAVVADVFNLVSNPNDPRRIESILTVELFDRWPFRAWDEFTLDISFQTKGVLVDLGRKPRRRRNESPEEHQVRKTVWLQEQKDRIYRDWDDFGMQLEDEVLEIIHHHGGVICDIVDDGVAVKPDIVSYPDSITMRVTMGGEGFNDLIRNHPRVFEVVEPDIVESPLQTADHDTCDWPDFEGLSPKESAPLVGVIDSGIQEGHRYLNHAIKSDKSLCVVPGKNQNDVSDEVNDGGHGTRVAGAVLFPKDDVPAGPMQAGCWLGNFRVLDENNGLSVRLFPPGMLERAVQHLRESKVFVHSINTNAPCRLRHMSAWAAKMDDLSHRQDVLFVVSTGNLQDRQDPPGKGILDHLASGNQYPDYLLEPSARIAQPAQSLQALTVGSIAKAEFVDGDWSSIASQGKPSSFTRCGPGIWDTPKPDIVEVGGDLCRLQEDPPPTLTVKPEVAPMLIRSTLRGGPSMAQDDVGTSFAAPKVAALAAEILATMPECSALMLRALIANSARWPEWADEETDKDIRGQILQQIGYGLPSWERALRNESHRVTLITSETLELKAGEAAVFEVPIPQELSNPGEEYRFRIDVTLSYSSEPRRTRASLRGYQSVWLDWRSSNLGQALRDFRAKMWKDEDATEAEGGRSIPWMLGAQDHHGQARGLRRCGSLQKDWAECIGYDLPDTFAIAVRGHKGWNEKDPEATARYTLAVTMEAHDPDIEVYNRIKNAIETRVRAETAQVTVET